MRAIWLIAALLGGLWLAWQATREPAAVPADAPATVFASGRAMGDIRVIARAGVATVLGEARLKARGC
jgi:hypothetical protein